MLPSLATVEQFEVRIPGGVEVGDYARAQAALDDASSLVRTEASVTWVNAAGELFEVPDVAVTVAIAAARRAFVNPDMIASESIQDYSTTFSSSSSDIYLTKAERLAIRRITARSGLWTLATTRTDVGSDTPSVSRDGYAGSSSEEHNPFGEGWTG